MGVQGEIIVEIPIEGVHRPGQPVRGIVKYAIDTPTVYRRIKLTLTGIGKCIFVTPLRIRRVNFGLEQCVKETIDFLYEPEEPVLVPVGQYEYPFEFLMPDHTPPSIKNRTCTISYHVNLIFIKPSFFSLRKVFKKELLVYSYCCDTRCDRPIMYGIEKTVFKPFAENPKFNVKAVMDTTLYAPGVNVKVSLIVTNNTRIKKWSIITRLRSDTVYFDDFSGTKWTKDYFKKCTKELKGSNEVVTNMTSIVPLLPELYSVHHSKVMDRNYSIIVTLKLPFPHFNASVEMPFIIGETKTFDDHVIEIPHDEEFQ